jgi:hypothetical protein
MISRVKTTPEDLERLCQRGKLAGSFYEAERRVEASIVFRVVLLLWRFLMDVQTVSRLSDEEKEPIVEVQIGAGISSACIGRAAGVLKIPLCQPVRFHLSFGPC